MTYKPFVHGKRLKRPRPWPTTRFEVGDAVRDPDTRDVGHVEIARDDGTVNVLWLTGAREWVHENDLVWAVDVARKR